MGLLTLLAGRQRLPYDLVTCVTSKRQYPNLETSDLTYA
jgi:hypothetical protein